MLQRFAGTRSGTGKSARTGEGFRASTVPLVYLFPFFDSPCVAMRVRVRSWASCVLQGESVSQIEGDIESAHSRTENAVDQLLKARKSHFFTWARIRPEAPHVRPPQNTFFLDVITPLPRRLPPMRMLRRPRATRRAEIRHKGHPKNRKY